MNFAVQLRASFLLSLVLCASALAQSAQPNPAGSAFKYTSFQVPGSTYTVALGVNNKGGEGLARDGALQQDASHERRN